MVKKRIVLAGGSGQVGTILRRAWQPEHEVVVVSRSEGVPWDGLAGVVDGADVVVNLAGRSVNCRYTAANRREIMDSRVETTRAVGEAIARATDPPKVWLQASTATIYAPTTDAPNDERGPLGSEEGKWGFSIQVANAWERAALEADTPHTRKVLLRSAITLSPDRGGIFDVLLSLVRRRIGGTVAGGRQWVSWVHHRDFARALDWLIEHDEIEGPVNVAAPHPLPQREFFRVLREAWGTRVGLPASRWMLEVAAFAMRTETELMLKSRWVVPGRLTEGGFAFDFPDWPEAARDLVGEWRAGARDLAGGRRAVGAAA
jgi:uncharacterized protein (TIGR01777 family)